MSKIPFIALVYATVTPILWAGGIILMATRFVRIPSETMPLFVSVGTLISCLPFTLFHLSEFGKVTFQQSALALVAGMLNGFGFVLFWGFLVGGAGHGRWELSTVSAITFALLPGIIAVGSGLFLDEAFPLNKTLGIICAIVAIWLLNYEA
jgi:drug/metabolite transporter (DMT)-like permease